MLGEHYSCGGTGGGGGEAAAAWRKTRQASPKAFPMSLQMLASAGRAAANSRAPANSRRAVERARVMLGAWIEVWRLEMRRESADQVRRPTR